MSPKSLPFEMSILNRLSGKPVPVWTAWPCACQQALIATCATGVSHLDISCLVLERNDLSLIRAELLCKRERPFQRAFDGTERGTDHSAPSRGPTG